MQHLDEGTIHAWLDGELPEAEASAAGQHTRSCEPCAAKVAEARGLIAAASRILTSLDDVPSGVLPRTREATLAGSQDELAALRARHRASQQARQRAWWRHPGFVAAAAMTFVAIGTWGVVRRRGLELTTSDAASPPAAAFEAPAASAPSPLAAPDSATSNASRERQQPQKAASVEERLNAPPPKAEQGAGVSTLAKKATPAAPELPAPVVAADRAARAADSGATTLGALRAAPKARPDTQVKLRLEEPVVTGSVERASAQALAGLARERQADARRDEFAPQVGPNALMGCYSLRFEGVGGGPLAVAGVRLPSLVQLDTAPVDAERPPVFAARDASPATERVPGEYRWRPTGVGAFELIALRDQVRQTFPTFVRGNEQDSASVAARPMPAGAPMRLAATKERCP